MRVLRSQRRCISPSRPLLSLLPITARSTATSKICCQMSAEEYLDLAVKAARQAGNIILEAWDKPRKVEHKKAVDLVWLWMPSVTCFIWTAHNLLTDTVVQSFARYIAISQRYPEIAQQL